MGGEELLKGFAEAAYAAKASSLILLNPYTSRTRVREIRSLEPNSSICGDLVAETSRLIDAYLRSGLQALYKEYHRLFSLPDGLCPPFESYYVFEDGRIGDTKILRSLNVLYARAGLDASFSQVELLEFLGVELEFMAYLAGRVGSVRDVDAERILETMLRNHVFNWLPRFASCLETKSGHEVYRMLGRVLALLNECLKKLMKFL